MVNVPEHIIRLLVHPNANKVMCTVSEDNMPHAIVCASLVFIENGDNDHLAIGESGMLKTVQNLKANPNVEILVWQGKEGYAIKAKAIDRYTSGSVYDKISSILAKKNIKAEAVWEFDILEVWNEGLSPVSGGQKVM